MWVFGGSGSGWGPCTVHLTSGHGWADVLQREDGQLLLRVDPDHAVTQTLHGQHATTGRRAAFLHRPAGENTSVRLFFWKISLFFRKWGHFSKERPTLESHGYFGRVRTFFFPVNIWLFFMEIRAKVKNKLRLKLGLGGSSIKIHVQPCACVSVWAASLQTHPNFKSHTLTHTRGFYSVIIKSVKRRLQPTRERKPPPFKTTAWRWKRWKGRSLKSRV